MSGVSVFGIGVVRGGCRRIDVFDLHGMIFTFENIIQAILK